jgi:ATP-dependent DNA helicase RecQ
MESYYQETGRAGRDGLPSVAWMVYSLQDIAMLSRMVDGSEANEDFKRVLRHKLNAFVGFCETIRCRRQVILEYFGERETKPCGNCDTCLLPVDTIEGTELAQKALSCIYRTGAFYGAGHLIKILRGELTLKIQKAGHDQLKVFGMGSNISESQWSSIFRQLTASGVIKVDMLNYGSIKLLEKSTAILKGEVKVVFRKDPEPALVTATYTRKKKKGSRKSKSASGSVYSSGLYGELRALRSKIADELNYAPFMILHNKALEDIIRLQPKNMTEMGEVYGMGQKKLLMFGRRFLDVVTNYQKNN